MLRSFEARIRVIREGAGFYQQSVKEDGLSETVGWILYRNLVDDETRKAQVADFSINPYREALKALKGRAA